MKRRPAKNTARRARLRTRRPNPARKTIARAALTYDAVGAMGGAEINKRLDALDRESSAITDEFIATGRGHDRPSERRHKTDPLSLRDAQNAHDRYVLHAEIARRYGPGAPSRLPTRVARTIRTRNPSKRSASSRRRNPAPKPRTYASARADILRALRADGWDVRENLKVPHATHPSGEFRLWFKTQAIYFTTGDRRRGAGSLSDAHSLWIGDIRTMPVAEVLADIERARRQSVGPQRNPPPSQNQAWRMHHESEAVQAGVIRKDYPLAAHHYSEAAKYVADKPRLVAYYRKEAEKYRSLAERGK